MKSPRDFVHVDEFWEAAPDWPSYFIGNKVWAFCDEYRAELIGDQDYCRIVVHAGDHTGMIYKRRLSERANVEHVLQQIHQPVARQQLLDLGFSHWRDSYD